MREQLVGDEHYGARDPQVVFSSSEMQRTRSGSQILLQSLKQTVETDSEANIPVERMHGLVDALFPIIATVLFTKNFSEIGEAEAELMIEACTAVEADEADSTECTWSEIGGMMWWGSQGNSQRFDRLVATCAVFCLCRML
eukprot:COSAG02_NODE_2747_length_8108_cov_3.195405_3_plen_141_part_00